MLCDGKKAVVQQAQIVLQPLTNNPECRVHLHSGLFTLCFPGRGLLLCAVSGVLYLFGLQQTGTFAFVKCAGLTGQQDTCSHTFKIDIPREIETMNIGRFCCDCRVLLAETNNSGFAIVDCFDLGNMKAYNIENGAEYAIRDYTVSVNEETRINQLSVTVCGNANNLIFID